MRSIPRDSRTGAGNHDNSASVSTKTDCKVRRSLGCPGFSISRSTRKVPMSSAIIPPVVPPSSTTGTRVVSISRAAMLGTALAVCAAPKAASQGGAPAWTRGAVCYEVFVRSFYDSDGDGIGDLKGLIQKLDYINDGATGGHHSLGARCMWLMPVDESPSYHGYDVTNYYRVNPQYGTNDDFKKLIAESHRRGIRVL